ncbi:glycosyltransferase [Caproicibacter sp.]|uniref:glycosyltransferase n=1 Tax=Caproicibacter sp. TaxID=2814884 RepID=UPI003988AD1C
MIRIRSGGFWGQVDTFGLKNCGYQAYEKVVSDRFRYRGTNLAAPSDRVSGSREPDAESGKPFVNRTIVYLVHRFFPESQGGTEQFVLNIAKSQPPENRVVIFTYCAESRREFPQHFGNILFREDEFQGLRVIRYRHLHAPEGILQDIHSADPDLTAFAKQWFRSLSPDFVHCAYPSWTASFLTICQQMKIPYGITLTDFQILCHYATMIDKKGNFCTNCHLGVKCGEICSTKMVPDPGKRFRTALELLTRAAFLSAPSGFVAERIETNFPGVSVFVIPHGISGKISAIPRETVKTFLYLGKLSAAKGVHLLIRAFRQVSGDIRLKIYGSGSPLYQAKLKRIARGDRRISFCGAVSHDEIDSVYRSGDCVIIPSLWEETYNMVLSEAMASGAMVIASDAGAMRERVRDGVNGYLFPCGNQERLAEAIRQAMEHLFSPGKNEKVPGIAEEHKIYVGLYEEAAIKKETEKR